VPKAWVQHHSRFRHQDPAATLLDEPPGRLYHVERDSTPRVRATEMGLGFVDCGLRDSFVLRLYSPLVDDLFLGMYRLQGMPAFSADDRLLLELVYPHLAGALASRRAIALVGAPVEDETGAPVGSAVLHFDKKRVSWDPAARDAWEAELGRLDASGWRALERRLFAAAARFSAPRRGGRSQLLLGTLRVEFAHLPDEQRRRRMLAIFLRESGPSTLDDRLLDVARLAASGVTIVEIARRMGRSREAIRRELNAACARLRVSDRRELALRLQSEGSDAADPVSPRERQVLRLVDRGLSYKEIAAELRISVHTVHAHLKNAYARLGASGKRRALARARARGLLGL